MSSGVNESLLKGGEGGCDRKLFILGGPPQLEEVALSSSRRTQKVGISWNSSSCHGLNLTGCWRSHSRC